VSTVAQPKKPTTIDIQAIRDRAASATFGPWMWHGQYETKSLTLCTKKGGMQYVMGFKRWGMQGAQPEFNGFGRLTGAADLPVFQVAPDATSIDDPRVYRGTLVGIRHPDAEFIAHSRQDVDDLLAYIDELESRLEGQAQS
jgi:hypothetical protein